MQLCLLVPLLHVAFLGVNDSFLWFHLNPVIRKEYCKIRNCLVQICIYMWGFVKYTFKFLLNVFFRFFFIILSYSLYFTYSTFIKRFRSIVRFQINAFYCVPFKLRSEVEWCTLCSEVHTIWIFQMIFLSFFLRVGKSY